MTDHQEQPYKNTPNAPEAQAAGQVVLSLNSAFKYYSLYPEGHDSSRNNLIKFKTNLDQFLADYSRLHLDIVKNGFVYKDVSLYKGPVQENNPAYLLTRDGLLWLEFYKDIELTELKVLFNILNRHRYNEEVADGDIVTALWQADLKHILYEAADVFATDTIQLDLSMFKVTPDQGTLHTQEDESLKQDHPEGPAPDASEEAGATSVDTPKISTALPLSRMLTQQGTSLSALNPREKKIIEADVQDEERRDFTEDVIDVLLIMLVVQRNKTDCAAILSFIEDEFFATMARGDFHLAYKLCRNIKNILKHNKKKIPWIEPLIHDFFVSLATPKRLAELPWMNTENGLADSMEKVEYLWPVFSLLPSEVILSLGPLAARSHSENILINKQIVQKILQIITVKAQKKPDIFLDLSAKSDEKVNLSLFPVISRMEESFATEIYLQMTHHGSALVRKNALEAYFRIKKQCMPEQLSHLFHDPSKAIREKFIDHLGQSGNKHAEALLVDYIEETHMTEDDPQHILKCYAALGRCGSDNSIPMLKKVLMDKKWSALFSQATDVHKQGAALALKALGTKKAEHILREGLQNLRTDIRNACQNAFGK